MDASIPVQTGSLNVKVWLSGPDIPASTFATPRPNAGRREPSASSRSSGRPPDARDPVGRRFWRTRLCTTGRIAYNPHPSGRSAAW